MHDAIQFERLGVPATLVMTEPFQGLAERFAATLGSPAYPTVMVPHPVSGKDADAIDELARSIVGDVVARLTR